MGKKAVVSAKILEEIFKEFDLRVEKGESGNFIRDAIVDKLENVELFEIKTFPAKLEVLTYELGKINPQAFGIDETDHKTINYLLHYKGATTPELAENLGTNR